MAQSRSSVPGTDRLAPAGSGERRYGYSPQRRTLVAWWIMPIALLLIAAWVAFAYNRLVRLRNQMRTGWADIDVQLTRRHDLVPQLVTAVRAYAAHERGVLEAVTELRSQALQQTSPARLGEVESALEQALARLFALKEAYPELQSSENFVRLQRDLVAVEDHLQYARRFYNGAVRDYNNAIEHVPDRLVARAFAFRAGEFYQARNEERAAVRVQLP
jgi:LemA protein